MVDLHIINLGSLNKTQAGNTLLGEGGGGGRGRGGRGRRPLTHCTFVVPESQQEVSNDHVEFGHWGLGTCHTVCVVCVCRVLCSVCSV